MVEYVYMLIEREFIKTKENIYKIGETGKENDIRFKQYPRSAWRTVFEEPAASLTEEWITKYNANTGK